MNDELPRLKALLWERWDPIGVNGDEWAPDEYDNYADRVFAMLNAGATCDQIAEYLSAVQTKNMGLSWSDIHKPVAAEAVRIHEEGKP